MSGTYPKTELSSPKAQTRRMTLAYGSNLRMMTRAKAALLKMIIQVPVLAHVTARKLVLCNQMLYQQLYKLSIWAKAHKGSQVKRVMLTRQSKSNQSQAVAPQLSQATAVNQSKKNQLLLGYKRQRWSQLYSSFLVAMRRCNCMSMRFSKVWPTSPRSWIFKPIHTTPNTSWSWSRSCSSSLSTWRMAHLSTQVPPCRKSMLI